MQIAFDAKRAFANRRGLGNYSRDVIRLMLTYAPENDYTLCGVPTSLCDAQNVQLCQPKGIWSLIPSLWRSWGCLHQLKGIDIYHGLSGELPFGIHRTSMRTVVTIHDTIFLRYPNLYSPTYRWIFTHKMAYAIRVADSIFAISEQTKSDIIRYFNADESKIHVVYQGCNAIFRQPIAESQVEKVKQHYALPANYLLYVGALEERKNLHTLVQALAIEHIDTPLVLVGAHSKYGEQLKKQAAQAGIELHIVSHVKHTDLPAIYKGATLFVYPSIYEGFGIPILEAMCVGVPVVTSTGSCFAETGGDAALYADPTDPQTIANQLRKVLKDTSLREQMIAQGHLQSAKFTDEKVAANLINLYAELN